MLLTADKIHDGRQWLPEGSTLEATAEGEIVGLYEPGAMAGAVHYEGALCPGFVNAHCHIELSHLRGAIPEGTGLIPFLQQVVFTRNNFSEAQKKAARSEAITAMLQNGIVAVGDIANTADALDMRAPDAMHFHTFIECIGFSPERAAGAMAFAEGVEKEYAAQVAGRHSLRQSVVPHAPYSVSEALFRLISGHRSGSIISVHNQEAAAENEFYEKGSGAVNDLLGSLGINPAIFSPAGKSSLQTYLQWIDPQHPLLLVHDTFTTPADVACAQQRPAPVWWCLCPNANLYIEGRLPDVAMLATATQNICIGTDSLSSNHQLSVLAELQTLDARYPEIGWETLLRWGTHNGAKALQLDAQCGAFAEGARPGILQVTGMGTGSAIVQRIC